MIPVQFNTNDIGMRKLVKKIEKMTYQCTRKEKEGDAVLIIEGREGTGKTNGSVFILSLVKQATHRDAYLYFNLDKLISKAQSTTGKIFIWDEPALQALSTDSLNNLNRDLIRLLMTCRINRHFFIINIVDFVKFNTYITVERPLGFIHLFKGRVGHACYIRFRRLEALRRGWDDYKKRMYRKYKSFFFEFPQVSAETFDSLNLTINGVPNASYETYIREKKLAIAGIGHDNPKDDKKKLKWEIKKLKKLIATEPRGLTTNTSRALHYKVAESQLRRWAELDLSSENPSFEGDRGGFKGFVGADMINTKGDSPGAHAPPVPGGSKPGYYNDEDDSSGTYIALIDNEDDDL